MNVSVKKDFSKIPKMMFALMSMNATQIKLHLKCFVKIHINAQIQLVLITAFARRVYSKFLILKYNLSRHVV